MRLLSLRMLAVAVGLALGATSAWAAGEEVKFDTADHVELHGTYYPGKNGKKSFTVLLLHAIDPKSSSKSDAYVKLAEALQAAGCAVLAFDFRGHGDSTAVDKDFWLMHPVNQRYVSGYTNPNKLKESILEKDFKPSYIPVLANDVMAAKMYLDRRNDAGECNSGKLIIIGAGEGATLGLLWAYTELYRYTAIPGTFPVRFETKPHGRDIAGIIGVGMSPSLANRNVSQQINTWLRQLNKEKVPVSFIYGKQDASAKSLALNWLKNGLQVDTSKNKPDPDRPFTWHLGIETKLSGQALVSDKLDTIANVTGFVGRLAKDEKAENWERREADKNAYVWAFPNFQARAKEEKQRVMNPLPLQAVNLAP